MANHLDLEEQEQLDQLKHFWNTWGTLISTVVIAIAGSFAAWNGYQYWQNRQASQAAALFDAVDAAATAGDMARMGQAFGDIKANYPGTAQASQAGLVSAQGFLAAGNLDASKEALRWVAEQSADEGLKALAKLRLGTVFMDQKNYDEASALLSAPISPQFEGVFADRLGDLRVLQGKRSEAVAEYTKAHKAFGAELEYRRLVEIKLSALGAAPEQVSMAGANSGGVIK